MLDITGDGATTPVPGTMDLQDTTGDGDGTTPGLTLIGTTDGAATVHHGTVIMPTLTGMV